MNDMPAREILPDGFVEVSTTHPIFPDHAPEVNGIYRFRAPFDEMEVWKKDNNGITIFMVNNGRRVSTFIPYSRIVCVDLVTNSPEVVEALESIRLQHEATCSKPHINLAAAQMIVDVLASQALSDHLGDVRDAERTLWSLLGVKTPVTEHEEAWPNTQATLAENDLPRPTFLKED